jgi:hypothetical protein
VSRRIALVTGALAFVAIALVVGRWLQADNVERAKVLRLLEAQARGDAAGMAREVEPCDGTCQEAMVRLAGRMRVPGAVEIVRLDSPTSHAVREETGVSRVVWRAGDGLPTVQCVTVRRKGNALSGPRVTLTAVSAPIGREAGC